MQITYDPARELQIGDTASLTTSISDEDVRSCAEISGDCNLVHLSNEFAARTLFNKRTPHGALSGALISADLGITMPGTGTIYFSQTFKFKALGNTARRAPRGRRSPPTASLNTLPP